MDQTTPATPQSSTSTPPRPFRVVAAIDMSEASPRVFRRALLIANASPGSEVHVVLVVDPPSTGLATESVLTTGTSSDSLEQVTRFVEEQTREIAAHAGPLQVGKVVAHLLTGAPAAEIAWLAAHVEADLVVLGTHGRTGFKRALLGSVAERVVRHAGCAVFVDRATKHDPAAHDPDVLPVCDACRQRRQATQGKELWCERHAEHHVRGHVYSGPQMSVAAARPWGFS